MPVALYSDQLASDNPTLINTDILEKGRAVYNFRCYFCHGYNGDAKTEAAQYLSPKPRNFIATQTLPIEAILDALTHGRPGTAMKSFARTISLDEQHQVALFVYDEFIKKKNINTYYHTVENGWANHKERYGQAYPFVLGQIPIDTPHTDLNDEQKMGLDLFRRTCITCHEGTLGESVGKIWDKYPLSHQGCGVVCHENGEIDFPWTGKPSPVFQHKRPSTPYEAHGTSPQIADMSEEETIGEALYTKNCAFCHAMDGTGGNWIGAFLEPHARDFTDPEATAHLDKDTLNQAIRNGVENTSMPAWGAVLTDAQINAVAAYVRRAFFMPQKIEPVRVETEIR